MDEFRLLGPLEVVVDERPVSLGGEKPRALLALLLLERNRTVPTERLVDALWGERPPAQATKTLQVYISQLRKALGAERVVTRPPGYELRVADGELDLDRFESLAVQARELLRAGDARAGSETLREALALWRGPALREFRAEPFAEPAGAALEEQRLAALEDRLQADLDTGATAEAVPELEALVAAAPLRERPRALLMLALYRSGRQADALELFRRTRELFVEELGLEPGPELRELEAAMLRQDANLQAPRTRPAVEPAAAGRPARPRPRGWAIAAAALVAASAAVAVAFAVRGSSDGGTEAPPTTTARPAGERVFVFRVENFLTQSHAGRNDVRRAVDAALNCRLSRRAALAQLNRVQRNRQSLLEQLAALSVPEGEAALRAADLFQKATLASITADWAYRDWLEARPDCAARTRPPARVRALDARATELKRRFLAAFDPLAARYGQRVWRADEI